MKKNIISENYLEKVPVISLHLKWSQSEDGRVTLEIENTGFFNKVAQKFFRKPEISYVHLDEMGSFVWPLIDGETNILNLANDVKSKFGEAAEPLYERLAKFFPEGSLITVTDLSFEISGTSRCSIIRTGVSFGSFSRLSAVIRIFPLTTFVV